VSRAAAQRAPAAARPDSELDVAVRDLTALGTSLARSYHALEERAQRVEGELAHANRELARKVAQLDAVTAELEAVLDALPTGVVVRDADGGVVRVNGAALSVLGKARGDVLGSRDALLGADGEGGEWREEALVRDDGARCVVAHRRCEIGGAGRARSVEILDDRTALVELSERMHALDKLAALGDMAGGIAHELRNPMMAVKGFADLLAKGLQAQEEPLRWAKLIVEGVDEANGILSSMMSLASPDKLVLETIDAAELAREALAMAQRDAGVAPQSAEWRFECVTDALRFGGDRIKLRQALRNLIANALQAQGARGAVQVEIALDGETLALRVSDAGPGIPREFARRVLEPFFTTRAEGTGLGLALVERIAELHGGRVNLVPTRGPLGGASIAVCIPYRSPLS
jgi:two-component system sensor histidine kinase HydH